MLVTLAANEVLFILKKQLMNKIFPFGPAWLFLSSLFTVLSHHSSLVHSSAMVSQSPHPCPPAHPLVLWSELLLLLTSSLLMHYNSTGQEYHVSKIWPVGSQTSGAREQVICGLWGCFPSQKFNMYLVILHPWKKYRFVQCPTNAMFCLGVKQLRKRQAHLLALKMTDHSPTSHLDEPISSVSWREEWHNIIMVFPHSSGHLSASINRFTCTVKHIGQDMGKFCRHGQFDFFWGD